MRQRRWIELFSDYDCEIRYHPGKANIVADALSRKERVKPVRVRAMRMTIFSGIKTKILEAHNEVFKEINVQNETLWGLDKQMKRKEDGALYFVGLTKSAHFLAIYEDYNMEKLARLYINEVVARLGVTISIISDRDGRFTSRFWEVLQRDLETCLDMSTTYHHQTDDQRNWDAHLPLAELSYSSSYHTSVKCAPFEALYRQKCRSPIFWDEVRESQMIGPEIVQETTDKIFQIKDRLKAARYRQKSYADNRQKPLEFCVGDHVLLKVSPWKGVVCLGKKGKLAPRFVGPFKITKRIGPVTYRLKLPQELSGVHDMFHVSNLKKCLADETLHVLLGEIHIDVKLHFVEEPMEIMDREIKKLKCSKIPIVKVRWNSKRGPKFTWERENHMKLKYPHLFNNGPAHK
ncbi:putative reverse transcriptase domain-containing protein [Tanacetum coccineum]